VLFSLPARSEKIRGDSTRARKAIPLSDAWPSMAASRSRLKLVAPTMIDAEELLKMKIGNPSNAVAVHNREHGQTY